MIPSATTPATPTVVVGFAEALAAPEVVWSLVDAGFRVHAFARRGRRAPLRRSRHATIHEITAPEENAEAAQRDLLALLTAAPAGSRKVVIFPLDDAALWLSAALPARAEWIQAGASGAQAAIALDKRAQVRHAREAGFAVPASTLLTARDDWAADDFEYPLIVRPADAVARREGRLQKGRNWICSDATEFLAARREWRDRGPLLVQPFIRGTGEGIFGLATAHGVIGWSAHRRLRMMNPHGSGSSACISQPVASDVRTATERFIAQTGWRGLFMVEILRDAAGQPWFVEFNGRPWGSMALARRRGFEYPAWAIACALDPDTIPSLPATPAKPLVCRHAAREFMHLLFVLRGPRSKALTAWPSFWRTVLALLAPSRRHAFSNWRRDDPRVFFSDWWCTVRGHLFKSTH